MENLLLDRQSSGSFELPKMPVGRCRRGLGARPRGAYNNRSYPTTCQPYHQQQHKAGGAWSSSPALPYAVVRPPLYSSPSLPLLPSNQPPLLPLPPTATMYATFPCLPSSQPPQSRVVVMGAAAATATVPAAAPAPPPRQREIRRRRPARPPPPTSTTEPAKAKKNKPLERATPLPPAPVVNEALDDLEQEVARNFVQDLLHVLAPPPSSLPLPRFSLVVAKASSPAPVAGMVVPTAPYCNVEAATADGIRGLVRL